jgi:uncharacterized membrane protein YphA (DoxX/SURF4 family)
VDTVVTIVQILLGLAFVAAGANHLRLAGMPTPPPRMAWAAAVPPTGLRMIAAVELVGGAVVVVTALTGPAWLAGLAAVGFVLLMVAAGIFHLRRAGEVSNAFFNLVLGAVALVIAYANFV